MDNSVRALKISIIVQWVLIAAAVVIGLFEEHSLPEALRSYIVEQDNKPLSQSEMILFGTGLFLVLGLIISSIGIYFLKTWARTLYVVCSVLGAVAFLFFGPVVTPPIEGTLQYMANALEGFTIALLFFSSARVNFESSNQSLREGRENRAPQAKRSPTKKEIIHADPA